MLLSEAIHILFKFPSSCTKTKFSSSYTLEEFKMLFGFLDHVLVKKEVKTCHTDQIEVIRFWNDCSGCQFCLSPLQIYTFVFECGNLIVHSLCYECYIMDARY